MQGSSSVIHTVKPTRISTETLLRSRATTDCMKCLVCKRGMSDGKEFVYVDDVLVGAIHPECYPNE